MKAKYLLGVLIPLLLIALLVIISSTAVGFRIEKVTEQAISIVQPVGAGAPVPVQKVTLTNYFFFTKRYGLPGIIACLNDNDGVHDREELDVSYSESEPFMRVSQPLFGEMFFPYKYEERQGVDVPPYAQKQLRIFVQLPVSKYYTEEGKPLYSLYYGYDELLLIEIEKNRRTTLVNRCADITSHELNQATHIPLLKN